MTSNSSKHTAPRELPDAALDNATGAGETRVREEIAFVFHKIEVVGQNDVDQPVIAGRI